RGLALTRDPAGSPARPRSRRRRGETDRQASRWLHDASSQHSPEFPMISGKTTLIAHLGYPTEAFKAPMIYNPWFDSKGIDAVVVPMGVKTEDYPEFFGK